MVQLYAAVYCHWEGMRDRWLCRAHGACGVASASRSVPIQSAEWCSAATLMLAKPSAPGQFLADDGGASDHRLEFAHSHVPGTPPKPQSGLMETFSGEA